MIEPNNQRLWVLKAKGSDSSFGGNEGYPDKPESYYVFDTTVKNHDHIKEGDLVVVVDKKLIIGYSSVERIDIQKGLSKTRYRCPICNTQEHYCRKNISPRHKCRNKHEFDQPVEEQIDGRSIHCSL